MSDSQPIFCSTYSAAATAAAGNAVAYSEF
jgi:hypothetical protein